MAVVVTGANGFIGKNLCFHLEEQGFSVLKVTSSTCIEDVLGTSEDIEFIFHLAGVNRPECEGDFKENATLTECLLDVLARKNIKADILFTSSIQVARGNAYGDSKLAAEGLLTRFADENESKAYICRLTNVFGKWCRPNYNSFVATFCSNKANGLPIQVHDPNAPVELVYIEDVCQQFIAVMKYGASSSNIQIDRTYSVTVGQVAELIELFKTSRDSLLTERVGAEFTRALYSTYLSYLRPEQFSYSIPSYEDERGVFAEMLKTKDSGQFSFFTAHPGITRGGHYHHSKNEKFLVIKGQARFCFKQIDTGELYELETSSEKYEIVETVPGWSHDITNIGEEEMLVMLWANEVFDREKPDTFKTETK